MTDIVPSTQDERDDAIASQPYDEEKAKTRSTLRSTTVGEAAAVMLVSGSSYDEIAHVLELDGPEHAKRITIRALASHFDDHDKDSLRRIVLGMYRQIYASALRRSENPRYTSREAAANNASKAVTEMVRVLGLEAPKQVEIYSPTATEIDSTLKQIAALVAQTLPEEYDVLDAEVVEDEQA